MTRPKAKWASTWEETLIKSKEIRWRSLKPRSTTDGLLNLDIHLPMTDIFRAQARRAFMHGMVRVLLFHLENQKEQKQVGISDLQALFEESGLPEVAAALSQFLERTPNETR